MKFILGTKVNMTQFFTEDGSVVPVTVVTAGPATVTRVFEKAKDGYDAVQLGLGSQKESRINKAQRGKLNYKTVKEFRLGSASDTEVKAGDVIDVTAFAPGDKIRVTSVSKGKGFQGVVKRHGFAGGPRTHGQKHSEREPGSIGGGLRTHVPKGMRMAGRMGSDRITQKNLKVVFVDKDTNTMLIKGAITGRRGTVVEIIG